MIVAAPVFPCDEEYFERENGQTDMLLGQGNGSKQQKYNHGNGARALSSELGNQVAFERFPKFVS